MDKKLLEIKQLAIDFVHAHKRVPAIDKLNLSINHGETLALVGSSGSGKTLTALSILQLLPHNACIHTESQILWKGKDLLNQTRMDMQKIRGKEISMIFQEASTAFNPVMTIGEQIESMLKRHTTLNKELRQMRVLDLLDKVGIVDPQHSARSYPHTLSGGMRQRAMIAMALAPEPDLLIADEPTTALDVTLQAQILKLLIDIQKQQNIGLLFITHDLAIAKQVAHRVAVMSEGRMLAYETSDIFFNHQHHAYTKALFDALPTWEKRTYKNNVHRENLLSVKNMNVNFTIKKSLFKKKRKILNAVNNVSFSIDTCQTFALVGESGSGKTTLAKGILGLVRVNAGEIQLNRKILTYPTRQRWLGKDIQIIFQDPVTSMNPHMRVSEILSEGAKAQRTFSSERIREQMVDKMLHQVGLSEDCKQRYPHEFSGGQRQRICIARALLMQPRLLICDEPTSALDMVTQMEILNLLKSLQESLGISYLLITHNMSVVSYLAHKIAVMYHGEIVEQGNVSDVLFSPQHTYTKKLLSAVPII
ncbi:MAG: transporter ATP-binding protein [Gammaproteobacteria bacterium]|jgi:ABC-type microcin C transport system duplicated ATPase subunit YejF|nr:transporter ATP-binding protein [Gammaproteobacteria bacterium]